MITPCFPDFPGLFLAVVSTHVFKLSYFWLGTNSGSEFAQQLAGAFQSQSRTLKYCQRTDMELMNIDTTISKLSTLLLLLKEKPVIKTTLVHFLIVRY